MGRQQIAAFRPNAAWQPAGRQSIALTVPIAAYQVPTLGIEIQGSAGSSHFTFCRSSIEIPSGDFTKAIQPSRGGRTMVIPCSSKCRHMA
jgi:hypothetical protein